MPIYDGNSKVKDLYYGGTKIKEAYYNGNKVYSSFKGIPVWRFTRSNGYYTSWLIGDYSVNGLVAHEQNVNPLYPTGISGTIGSANSTVTVVNAGQSQTYTYNRTVQFLGKNIHLYLLTSWVWQFLYVLDGTTENSPVFFCSSNQNGPPPILSLTDTTMLYSNRDTINATRDQSYLKYWTKDGLM